MGYRLAKQKGDAITVPHIIFKKLSTATEDQLRVALCAVAQGMADPLAVAQELGLSKTSVELAFAYWVGAGLFLPDGEVPAKTPALPKRGPRMTSRDIVEASRTDSEIALLISESQNLLGHMLSPAESSRIVTLYVQDKLPIDMILTVMAHFIAKGQRNVSYIEKVLISWREEGICDGIAAERHLGTLEKREDYEAEVAKLLGVKPDGFTAGERTLIARWYEDFAFDADMIEAALLRAGEKNNVRYLSGILKKWHASGYKTPRDIPAEGENLQPTGRRTPARTPVAKGKGILVSKRGSGDR